MQTNEGSRIGLQVYCKLVTSFMAFDKSISIQNFVSKRKACMLRVATKYANCSSNTFKSNAMCWKVWTQLLTIEN
jgi:hypothetical protein